MSFLSKFKRVPAHLPTGTAKGGLGGFLVDKGERFGASYGFGWIKGHYREKAMVKGQPIDLVAGAGLLAASVALNLMSNGRSDLAEHLERVGDAGMMSYLNTMGASKGASMAGRQVMAIGPSKTPGLPRTTAMGMVPPVDPGAVFLSADKVRNFANRR